VATFSTVSRAHLRCDEPRRPPQQPGDAEQPETAKPAEPITPPYGPHSTQRATAGRWGRRWATPLSPLATRRGRPPTAARARPKLSPVTSVRNGPHPAPASPAAAPACSANRMPGTAEKYRALRHVERVLVAHVDRCLQDATCGLGEKWALQPRPGIVGSPGTSQERLRRRYAIGCADSGQAPSDVPFECQNGAELSDIEPHPGDGKPARIRQTGAGRDDHNDLVSGLFRAGRLTATSQLRASPASAARCF
jgi:hypothetical protein